MPVGGYLEISNSAVSHIVAIANTADALVEFIKLRGELSTNVGKIDDDVTYEIVKEVLDEILKSKPISKKLVDVIKDTAIDELKNANWSYGNYGDRVKGFSERLSSYGINLFDAVAKKIVSVTGVLSISKSVIKKVIPAGNLINFLFNIAGVMDEGVLWENFKKSVAFPKGIYIYAPNAGNYYQSNNVIVVPELATEPNTIIHAYLVLDTTELEVPNNTFDGDFETHSITMYRDGKKIQPNSSVTVKFPFRIYLKPTINQKLGSIDTMTMVL